MVKQATYIDEWETFLIYRTRTFVQAADYAWDL